MSLCTLKINNFLNLKLFCFEGLASDLNQRENNKRRMTFTEKSRQLPFTMEEKKDLTIYLFAPLAPYQKPLTTLTQGDNADHPQDLPCVYAKPLKRYNSLKQGCPIASSIKT